jgi:hypothetical protein
VLRIVLWLGIGTVTYDHTAATGHCACAPSLHAATYTALSDRKHLERLLKWAGPAKDFYGLLLFDESHKVSQ